MKKSIILTLLLMLLLAPAVPSFAQMTPKQIFDKWSSIVVTVETPKATGTGFFDKDGKLFTAYHVLAGADTATIKFANGYKEIVSGVLSADKTRDIAVLSVPVPFVGVGLGDYSALTPGEPIVVIGSPLGLSLTITTGIVSAKRTEGGVDKLQFSASISHGSSGSPVFNSNGEVVGMVVSSFEGGQSLNFAVAGNELKVYTGVPLKSVFAESQPTISTSLPTPPSSPPPTPSTGDITATTLATMYNESKGKPSLSRGLEKSPDFRVDVDLSNSDTVASKDDVDIWVRSGIVSNAPSAKFVSTDTTQERRKTFISTTGSVERSFQEWDEYTRNLYIAVHAVKYPAGMVLYSIELYFYRGVISENGFDTASIYSNGTFGYSRSSDLQDNLRSSVQRLVKTFSDAWNVANRSIDAKP